MEQVAGRQLQCPSKPGVVTHTWGMWGSGHWEPLCPSSHCESFPRARSTKGFPEAPCPTPLY